MERSFRVVVGFLLAASLFSCNFSKIEDFRMGKDFVSSTSGVVLIDTMKILASTVHLDSITTSKSVRLLVGGNQNAITGNVTCNPYFQFHSTSVSGTLATDLVYDSVVVKFNYDGYFIGDTTKLITFSVKPISPKQGYNSDGYNLNRNLEGYNNDIVFERTIQNIITFTKSGKKTISDINTSKTPALADR